MMSNQFLLLLILNFACALGFTFILYKNLFKDKTQRILAILRFLSFFLFGLLLINPKIDATRYSLEKPSLVVAVDNSESIGKLSKPSQVNQFINQLKNDSELEDDYDLQFLSFGSSLTSIEDSLTFSESNTDISKVIDYANSIEKENVSFVIITDGNQTLGEDYSLKSFDDNIIADALIVGDTAILPDSKIDLVNANNYAYFKNKFPVEIFLSQNTSEPTKQKLRVIEDENVLLSKTLEIPPNSSVKTEFLLSAEPVGIKTLKLQLETLTNEKNKKNNEKFISVDVIDSRSKILLISDLIHPDIGFFHRVMESSKQLEFIFKNTEDEISLSEYDLVIFYQPLSSFQSLINSAIAKKINYFFISGSHTDYSFLNSLNLGFQKEIIASTEEYSPVLNSDFNLFQIDNLNFESYPPLKDKFGDIQLNRDFSILLKRELNGIDIESPQWIFEIEDNVKKSFLFGENIWRWRARHYVENSSFIEFDKAFQKIIQFLSQSKFQDEIIVEVEPIINSGDNQSLKVFYYNSNFEIDTRFDFNIQLKNLNTNEVINSRLLKGSESYNFNLSVLKPGEYSYSINSPEVDISKNGKFQIIDYSSEMQFESANVKGILKLVDKENLYLFSNRDQLLSDLKNNAPKSIQKSIKKTQSLINFEWLILLLALTLGLEWFYRKYKGLI